MQMPIQMSLFARPPVSDGKSERAERTKPARCTQCGCKRFQMINGRWCCWRCGEVH